MRVISGLWRWRRNPLRRGTDLAEAWVGLVALLLILALGPVIGFLTGQVAQDALQQSVREQHDSRRPVTATVIRALDRSPLDADPEAASGRAVHSRVVADWTAPDGTSHQGTVMAELQSPHRGDHFSVWTDLHGRIAARPLDSATATTHAVLAGTGAALLTAGLIEGARRLAVWRMVRRRYARWDRAWERAGPDWGRTGTGS
ncbi:hypothetical protein [Streptomyces sp. NPDC005760]|uniref:Rv1733c family protein n=1 Tax=Streptomyces sp. NPDC005760 TaxID=3156718 RepID=UPI0033CF5B1C